MSSTLSLKMPLICSSLLLSMLISIALLPIGCNAGFPTAGGSPAAGANSILTHSSNSQNRVPMPAVGSNGTKSGGGGSPNIINVGHGTRNAGQMVAHGAGPLNAIPAGQSSAGNGMLKSVKHQRVKIADILARIHKKFSINEMHEKSAALNEEDNSAIQDVKGIYEKMNENLQLEKQNYIEQAIIANVVYNRIIAFYIRHAHQVIDLLAIFALAFDVKFNAIGKVEMMIKVVEKAIEFYKHDVDPNAYDVTHAKQKSKVEDVDKKNKMNKLKAEMEVFKTWLVVVYQKINVVIEVKHGLTEQEKAQEEYLATGRKIMEMLKTADGPFAKLGKFYSHLEVKETTGEKEVPNDKEYATAQSQHRNHHVHQQ